MAVMFLFLLPQILVAMTTMTLTTPWSKGQEVQLLERSVTLHGENGLILMEIEDTFLNLSSIQCEGLYRFAMPVGGFAAGFWINTDGKEWVKGEVREITEAKKIYHDITSRLVDPGLLEQKDGEILIRVFPVERNARVGVRFRCYFPVSGEQNLHRVLLPLRFGHGAADNYRREASDRQTKFRLVASFKDVQGIDGLNCSDQRAKIDNKGNKAAVQLEYAGDFCDDVEISLRLKDAAAPTTAFYQVPDGKKFSLLRISVGEEDEAARPVKMAVIIDASGSMQEKNRERALKLCQALAAMPNNTIQTFVLNENGIEKLDAAALAAVKFYGPTVWKGLAGFSSPDYDGVLLVTDGDGVTAALIRQLWLNAGRKPVRLVLTGVKSGASLMNMAEQYGGGDLLNSIEDIPRVVRGVKAAFALGLHLYDDKGSRYLPLYGSLMQTAYYVLPFRAGKYQVRGADGKSRLEVNVAADRSFDSIAPWFVSIAARQQIKTLELMEQNEAVVKKIVELGVRYSQATDYTAFLAVPESIARANADVMNPAYLAMFAAPNFRKAREQARGKACFANQRVLLGAVEMFLMDNTDISKLEFDLETGHFKQEVLVQEKYLKSEITPPDRDCEYRFLGDPMKDGLPFCVVHGSVEDGMHMSVEEMVKKYCREHNLDPDDFDIPYHLYGGGDSGRDIWSLVRRYELLQIILALML